MTLRIADLAGRRVGVWGLGEEGASTLDLLRARFPDQEIVGIEESAASAAVERWRAVPGVRLLAGRGAADRLARLDVVIKSPGVSLYRPEIAAACAAGTLLTSATRLWFAERAPASTVVAITGTKGKTTTASLLGYLLAAAGRRVEVAGNIGRPLLGLLDLEPAPEVWVVELSSYQIADLDASADWAALLNLFPEHLDWHGGVEAYYRDKLRLFRGQAAGHAAINARDPETTARRELFEAPVLFDDESGFAATDDAVFYRGGRLIATGELALVGRHNWTNACAALTLGRLLGAPIEPMIEALPRFHPRRHRLSRLGEAGGVLWVDDSISTVPQSAIAAIAAFPDRPLTLLVGGFDRGLDYAPLVEAVLARPVERVITLPDSGPRIAAEIEAGRRRSRGERSGPLVLAARDLADAVELARRETPAGGVVLLSPAAASYGRFKDHRERGLRFAELAGLGGNEEAG